MTTDEMADTVPHYVGEDKIVPVKTDLVSLALERGAGIDVVERVAALVERREAIEAKKQFAVAMNQCQAEMPTILKDRVNNETKKGYAPLETIKTWSKPHFIKHNFSLKFTSERGAQPGLTTVHLDITHVGGHTERSTLMDIALDNLGPKGAPNKTLVQGLMSTLSYAQGRLICLAFNLTVADEDRDGQAGTVTPDQVGLINDAIDACEKADRWAPDSLKKLCRVYEIEHLGELPANRLRDVLADLDRQLTGRTGVRK